MKLSYRDKIILLVFIIVVIVILGIVLIIKPLSKSIKENEVKLAQYQVEVDAVEDKIAQLEPLANQIKASYNNGKDIASKFYRTEGAPLIDTLDTYKIDQYLQEYLNKNSISTAMGLAENKAVKLEYYYYTPNIVTYPIFEAADLTGNITEELSKQMEAVTFLSTTDVQEVSAVIVNLDFIAQKSDVLQFIDDIKDITSTVIITQLTLEDYTFGEYDERSQLGYSNGDMTIMFYSMQPLEEPNLS